MFNVDYIIHELEKNIDYAKREMRQDETDRSYWQGYKEALQYALDRMKSLQKEVS